MGIFCFANSLATADGRALVAVGCAEGVWIGFRHDSQCESCASVRAVPSLIYPLIFWQPCVGCYT